MNVIDLNQPDFMLYNESYVKKKKKDNKTEIHSKPHAL